MRNGRISFGRIIALIIFFNILRGVFNDRAYTSPFNINNYMFVVIFLIFGISIFSKYMQNRTRNTNDDYKQTGFKRDDNTQKKSKYDFDDEYAIDPKDYE